MKKLIMRFGVALALATTILTGCGAPPPQPTQIPVQPTAYPQPNTQPTGYPPPTTPTPYPAPTKQP